MLTRSTSADHTRGVRETREHQQKRYTKHAPVCTHTLRTHAQSMLTCTRSPFYGHRWEMCRNAWAPFVPSRATCMQTHGRRLEADASVQEAGGGGLRTEIQLLREELNIALGWCFSVCASPQVLEISTPAHCRRILCLCVSSCTL